MAKKLEPVVGLDIGSHSIKCVEVSSEGLPKLRRMWVLPLSSSDPETVQKTLKTWIASYPVRPSKWRISVAGPSVLMRRIQLPVMTPSELKGAILFEAESQIPFPINDCQLDFQILNNQPNNKTMSVLLVAAKKDFVRERLAALSALGLTPESIDVDIFCLMNAFESLGDDAGHKTFGLLNIGHSKSSFGILQDKTPFAMRDIPVGGADVTRALGLAMGIPEEEAEKIKISHEGAGKDELKNATQKGFEALAEEIKHAIDYFENETGEDLKTIWVSGGGALAEESTGILSEELEKQVQYWDNLKKIEALPEVDKKLLSDKSRLLNVALGMALRGPRNNKP